MANAREGYGDVAQNVGPVITDAREAYGVAFDNVGPALADAREAAGYIYADVGVAIVSRDATGYLYWGDCSANTPTPHVWYVRPNWGREGWEFKVVGNGFGATQPTYDGEALLNDLACGIIDWTQIAASADAYGPARAIDADQDAVNVEHDEVRATVPPGAESGLVKVRTDGP